MIWFFVLLAVLVVLLRRRAQRRRVLAGLDGTRPVFSLEPPTRRLTSRKTEAL